MEHHVLLFIEDVSVLFECVISFYGMATCLTVNTLQAQ